MISREIHKQEKIYSLFFFFNSLLLFITNDKNENIFTRQFLVSGEEGNITE